MHEIALLRELQGERSQSEFAEMLGISQPMLSMVYQGTRRLGRDTIVRLMELFPAQRDVIIGVFLASDEMCPSR
jgi:plasmid maintenance system antidote protein VapI